MTSHPDGYCLLGDALTIERTIGAEDRAAVIGWLEAHDIDPATVPPWASFVADPVACTVTYPRLLPGGEGRTETVVLEGDVKPWPETLHSCPLMTESLESLSRKPGLGAGPGGILVP